MIRTTCRLGVLVAGAVTAGCGSQTDTAPQGPVSSEQATFELVTIAAGLDHPWGMAFLPGGDVLITERPGRLRLLRAGDLEPPRAGAHDPESIAGVPEVHASGQGGLLDVALDPEFAANDLIYLSYAAAGAGARPEIFSYGHRNPQGMAVHPETGEVWTHEHGVRGGDEVNVIRPGVNYGWPVITHGISYAGFPIGEGKAKPGMAQPLYTWVPSIAPSGMAFYTGEAFPDWRGDLFVGALKDKLLARLELDGERVVAEERLLEGTIGRIRDVETGPDGFLYLLTDRSDGALYRLEPAAGRDPA